MQKIVSFRPDQHVKADDFINMQSFARTSFDNIVADAVDADKKYKGLTTTATGALETTTDVGRIYSSGQVFGIETATVHSHVAYRPSTLQKIATVVAWGLETPDGIEPRAFVVDANASPPVFEPREVTMRSVRQVQLDVVYGIESASPSRGVIDSNVIPVCDILIGTAGIISVTMDPLYALVSTAEAQDELDDLTTWRNAISSQVDTLRTDMALVKSLIPPNLTATVNAMAATIRDIWAILNRPVAAVATFVDRFRNLEDSDTDHAGYSARVEDGLSFPADGPVLSAITLLNPTEPRVMTVSNITLPAYDEVVRLSIRPDFRYWISVINYPIISLSWVRHHLSRERHRYGDWCDRDITDADYHSSLSNLWGRSVVTDQASAYGLREIAQRPDLSFMECRRSGGEDGHDRDWPGFWRDADLDCFRSDRWQRYYHDCYNHPMGYWPAIKTSGTQSGASIAQTFFHPNSGWMTSVRLFLRDLGPTGDIQIHVCKTVGGREPDHLQVISQGTLIFANMHNRADGIRVPIVPVFLAGGEKYCIIVLTNGSHTHHTRDGCDYSLGSLWYRHTTGFWIDTLLGHELCFEIGMAKFRATRAEVQVNSVSLAGGVFALRILAAAHTPPGTQLTWQLQNGGNWLDIANNDVDALANNPVTVPMRLVFTGTRDVMPGIDLTQAEVEVSSTTTAFTHFSADRDYGAATITIRVVYDVRGWLAAGGHHTLNCHLIIGGVESGDAGSITTVVDPNDASHITRTYEFTVASTSTIDSIKTIGGTAGGYGFWSVAERWDHSF